MAKNFPDKTIFNVVELISEVGEKKLMIAKFVDDDNYAKNRACFLARVMLKCRFDHCEIKDIYPIRSREELDAHLQRIKKQKECNG